MSYFYSKDAFEKRSFWEEELNYKLKLIVLAGYYKYQWSIKDWATENKKKPIC